MQLFCIADVNCPPVELKRSRDGFSHSFVLKEPPPRFLVLFSQGKWLDSAENLRLEAKLIVNKNCQEFGILSKTNKSIMKELNLDSLSKKKTIQVRLQVKAIDTCSSDTSTKKKQKSQNVSADSEEPQQQKEATKPESSEKTKLKNSHDKRDLGQKKKKKVGYGKKRKNRRILESGQVKTSPRKDRNLKEVENLRNPEEIKMTCENSCNKSDDSNLTSGYEEKKSKGCKNAGTKNSKNLTYYKSQITDSQMKEVKENVPKAGTSKVVGKTKLLQSSSQKNKKDQSAKLDFNVNKGQIVNKESSSKDQYLSQTDDNKNTLQVKIGKKKNVNKMERKGKKLVQSKKSSLKKVNNKIQKSKTGTKKKKDVKQRKLSADGTNYVDDSSGKSINISKSSNIVDENEKKQNVSSEKKESKSKDLAESRSTSNSDNKKESAQKRTASISQVVKLTLLKNETKKELPKKNAANSKISKNNMVKTKQTTLQFRSLGFTGMNKEKSILKECGTPPNKRKLSVSFDNQLTEKNSEGTILLNDVKETKTQLEQTPKRRKTKTESEPEAPLKDTEMLMNINSSVVDIEDENGADQNKNIVDTLKTPHIKNTCKTPSPPKPPQKCKNKKARFEATPDSGSTPKKRSPKRIRTLKNEFAKSAIVLNKETNKKHPAICKDVTDRSCHPSERWGPTLNMISPNKAILIGGQGEKQVLNKDSVWSLNPETRKWKQLETKSEGPRPDLRMGHTATYDPTVRCIYIYGGSKNLKWFNDVHALDVDEKMWQLVKVTGKAPTRAYHTACLYRHEIWIFGGIYPNPDPQPDGCSNEIHVFSPVMGNWYTPIVNGEKPAARSGHSATIIKEEMVVFGGWDFPYCFNDIYILDLSLVEWRKPEMKGSPPKPRSWHASCALSHSRVLIHGGYDGDIALDDIHIFDVATMCWMEILLTCSPVPRVGHTCLCLPFTSANEDDDEVLIFGGGDNEKKFFGDLFSISVPFRPATKANQNLNEDLGPNQTSTVS